MRKGVSSARIRQVRRDGFAVRAGEQEPVNLEQDVMQKMLDGLYRLMAEKEKGKNPLEASTSLIKKVVGAIGISYLPRTLLTNLAICSMPSKVEGIDSLSETIPLKIKFSNFSNALASCFFIFVE